jgi:hypothetical protein
MPRQLQGRQALKISYTIAVFFWRSCGFWSGLFRWGKDRNAKSLALIDSVGWLPSDVTLPPYPRVAARNDVGDQRPE